MKTKKKERLESVPSVSQENVDGSKTLKSREKRPSQCLSSALTQRARARSSSSRVSDLSASGAGQGGVREALATQAKHSGLKPLRELLRKCAGPGVGAAARRNKAVELTAVAQANGSPSVRRGPNRTR